MSAARPLTRRAALALALALAFGVPASASLVACHRRGGERCARCGMVIAPGSRWEADLVLPSGETRRFDTARCGLRALRELPEKESSAVLRVHEFYDGDLRDAKDLVFVTGSDVVGPMGPEIVAVDPARSSKFMADHAGKQALRLAEVTPYVLAGGGP